MNLKYTKISSYISVVIILFLLIGFLSYNLLIQNIKTNHKIDTELLFYQIKNDTNNLLSKLLYEYSLQKDILIQKHKFVEKYLNNKDDILNINLEPIKNKINQNTPNKPYNIYITDENLIIRNSTYKPDLGFDLSFAKSIFNKADKQHKINCWSPILEKSSKKFFSFTDSYIRKENKKYLLQISYIYSDLNIELHKLQNLINQYKHIVDVKAYIITNTGFINDIILKDFNSYKPTLKEINKIIKDGKHIKNILGTTKFTVNNIYKNNKHYLQIYLSTKSAIFNDTKIVYSIVFDDSLYYKKLFYIRIAMIIIFILGLFAIFIISKIRQKEIKFKYQDKFINNAMHEIKTPLSVITLNNELRELEFGEDEYSIEIKNALKIMKSSYDDINHISNIENNINYHIEDIDLQNILKQRVEYFSTIAISKNKTINLTTNSSCMVQIAKMEIVRLIDNNISNAIKYAQNDSIIKISLKNNILVFQNYGNIIKNKNKIFDKFYRENNIIGGYGLGLNIVKSITTKNNIKIILNSDDKNGTIFKYIFKCHTIDISMR
jgi:hypothetical protein